MSRKNKLKIITTSLRYPPAPGGAEKMAEELVLRLVEKGHNVKVYTSNLKCHNLPNASWLKPWEYRDDPEYVKRLAGVYFDQFPYPYIKGMFSRLFREKKADLIHAHSFYYYPADISKLVSRIKRKPFVFNPYFYYQSREAKKWHLYRRTIGKATMRADCVLVISEYAKKVIKQFFNPKRIELVPPGLNDKIRKPAHSNIFDKYNLKGKRIIFFAGRICYGKGVDTLIKTIPGVVKKHPEAMFALAGGDFGDQSELCKLAQKLKVQDKMIWLGNLEEKNLVSAYQNADIFFFPTLFENFGIVLAEAMASGLPIVSTNHSAVPYVVPKEKAGFLAPLGDYKKMAYYLNKLLSNPKLAREMGEYGKKEAQKYDWDKMTEKIEDIYYSLL